MNFLFALLLLLLVNTTAGAQGCGQGNPNCVAPTPPNGDNSTRIANTAWVTANAGGGGGGALVPGTTVITGGTSEGVLFNNAGILGNTTAGASGAFLIGQGGTTPPMFNFLSGDCTALGSGAITCTKTAGNAFSNLATLSSIATSNVLGNFSGSSAAATAQSVPSCANDGGHALTNNAAAGFNCTVVSGSSVSLVVGTTPIASGISLGLLYNNAGILGNTAAPTNGQIIIGQPSGPPLWETMAGDCTIVAPGTITCTKTNGVSFGALATTGPIATSSVLANFSGSSAPATQQTVPTCANDGAHALTNNTGAGFNCASVTGSGSTTGPTQQQFTSGAATYSTPASVVWIEVWAWGGGGGGGGIGGTTGPTGGTGGNTTFGTTLLAANGGSGGLGETAAGNLAGAAGGTASLGSGPLGWAITGNGSIGAPKTPGGGGVSVGPGAASCNGGAPAAIVASGNGNNAATNSGAGGGGAVNTTAATNSAGGGAGGCLWAIILAPAATYAYAVGAGGAGGIGTGTNAQTGGSGAAGMITVIEHYNH